MARTDSYWEVGPGGTYIYTIDPAGYDILINGTSKYLNFNTTVGSSGYGFRDNAGTMEFKDSGGGWVSFAGSAAGVSSLNTLTGAVILAAGSGITLTPVGNTITITATGGSGGTPGGSTTQLQYNNAGSFGGISGATTDGTTVTLTTPVLNGTATGTGVSQSSSASTLVQRDASQNIFVNNYFSNSTSTVSAGGTTVLTIASSRAQTLTGSSSQTFQLPNATTLTNGNIFLFNNNSSSSLIITNNGASTLYTIPAGGYVQANLLDNGTANGTWDFHALPPSTVTWSSGIGGLVMNTALTTTPAIATGAASATSPVFIPQRGTLNTGYSGDSTNLYGVIGGATASTLSATAFNLPYLTASEMLITDASKNIVSAPVATYPSLTELTYLKGVTSAIQTQLNAKGAGTVTSVGWTGGIVSIATATTTPAFTIAGTSGGIPYFNSATTWATSAALAANALVVGGGAGVAPATVTTGANVLTALGVAVGSAGAFVTFNGALGTPSSGTVTNLTGTASININGTVGATTPTTGVFTTLVAGSTTSLLLGTAGSAVGNIGFRNATSGTITLAPVAGALGTVTLTLPAATDTVAVLAASQALTNKSVNGVTLVTGGTATKYLSEDGTYTIPAGGGGGITIGTTTITSGTNTRILYNNSGVVGEYTLTGTGTIVAMATSPQITTSLTTDSTTFALLNTTATTVNAFGAATTLNIGSSATCILNFGGGATASEFRFLEPSGSGTNYTAFKAVAQAANITYSLPPTVGAAGTILTDVAGNGVLTWGAAGAGDILNGGNTTGATVVIGTNDANALSLETNNVVRATVTGGASTGGAWTFTQVTANTNTVADILTLQTNSSGTALASFGGGILFQGESSTTDNRDMARIRTIWTTATDLTRTADVIIGVAYNGTISDSIMLVGGATPSLRIGSSSGANYRQNSILPQADFSIGGTPDAIFISGAQASGRGVAISESANAATSTASVSLGNGISYTQTSGTRNPIVFDAGFAPTSGTAVHNSCAFTGTFNQTGGANGITRGIYLNPTLTAVADFRGIESTFNTANAWHIYQTGSSAKGNTLVRTSIGTTTAPTALLLLAAGTATVSTAPLKFTSGTLNTTPEAGAMEFLTDLYYVTTTTGTKRRVLEAGITGRATGQTAANTSVATYTLGAADATYRVSANVLVTTSSAEAFTVTCDYTDEGNTARTITLNFQLLAGTIGTAINFANGAVPYEGIPLHIRCKESTAITIKTTGTFTGATYNVEGVISQIA